MDEPANSGAPTSWTRIEVARHLGVSITTVRRMEGSLLHPSTDERGVHHFERADVLVLRERRVNRPVTRRDDAGEIAARVFELFRQGADLRQVVMAARVPPRVVRELYAEWLVSLNDGESRRRTAEAEAYDLRERARIEREQRAWERQLRGRP